MNIRKTLLWITRTAVLIALLITFQWGLGSITGNNQFIVGSAVNLVLIVAAVTSGLFSGMTVALISPFMAYFLGVGPVIGIVPFVAVGNLVLVLAWYLIVDKLPENINSYVKMIIALITGAVLKFTVLYLTIVKYAIPYIVKAPAPKAAVSLFSWPQLLTASIGGVLAIIIIPIIKKAIKH